MKCYALVLGLFLSSSFVAGAAITGLINTGTDGSGSLLADGSVQPGWTITSVVPSNPPGGLTPPTPPSSAYVVTAYGYWIPNNAVSKWISYSTPLFTGGDIYREFTYSLTFQAAAGDNFFMRFSADNGTKAYLNQTPSSGLLFDWGSPDAGNFTAFQSFSPWLNVSGVGNGQNTLTFVVDNLNQDYLNPTGLRVEFSLEEPQLAVVPEPSTFLAGALLMLPFGLARLRLLRNRR